MSILSPFIYVHTSPIYLCPYFPHLFMSILPPFICVHTFPIYLCPYFPHLFMSILSPFIYVHTFPIYLFPYFPHLFMSILSPFIYVHTFPIHFPYVHTFPFHFPILAKLSKSGLHAMLPIICKFRDNWRREGHTFLRACIKLHLGTRVPGTPFSGLCLTSRRVPFSVLCIYKQKSQQIQKNNNGGPQHGRHRG